MIENDEKQRAFWLQFRQGLLVIIGAIESLINISPTTSDLRRHWREDLPKPTNEQDNPN